MIAGMITNGFLLSEKRIKSLNEAGLEHLQISIDNVTPDEVSKKSLKTLDSRLEWLAEHAVFQVNINSVLGSGVKNPEDALTIAHRAVQLGFTSTVGIIHDHNGQLKPLEPRQIEIFEEIMELGKRSFSRFNDFQHNVARAKEHTWRCRSGSRYLYVCEDGLVHWCSQQRGYPGIPLAQYTPEMRRHEYLTDKYCSFLRAAGGNAGQLARSTDEKADAHATPSGAWRFSADRDRSQRQLKFHSSVQCTLVTGGR